VNDFYVTIDYKNLNHNYGDVTSQTTFYRGGNDGTAISGLVYMDTFLSKGTGVKKSFSGKITGVEEYALAIDIVLKNSCDNYWVIIDVDYGDRTYHTEYVFEDGGQKEFKYYAN